MTTVGLPRFGELNLASWPRVSHRKLGIFGTLLLGLLLTGAVLLACFWPYRFSHIKPMLEDTFGCEISIRDYRRVYFPNPGFEARGVSLTRKSAPGRPPIVTIGKITVQSHWTDFLLFRKMVHLFELDQVHVILPPPGSQASREAFPPNSSSDFDGPHTPVQRFEVRNMILEIQRSKGGSYVFPVSSLHVENMRAGSEWTYAVAMQNPIPHGNIVASGRFGPLNRNVGETPVSGQFRFTQANLHDFGKLNGTVSSFGTFSGPLQALQTEATAATPDFAIGEGRRTATAGNVRCIVNGTNGDVRFQDLEVRTGSTTLRAQGAVEGSPHATNLDIQVTRGRAEDILRPFLKSDVPISGPVSLHAHAYIAPTREGDFLHRLKVSGAFDIPAEHITNQKAAQSLTSFSNRSKGEEDEEAARNAETANAISSLAGPAEIRDAVVTTHNLTFTVPGAQAKLDGTFNFHTTGVHLLGKLAMQSDLSHATTGFKSILLKPLAPFFRKKNAGALVSIAITGNSGHYQVQQNVMHNK